MAKVQQSPLALFGFVTLDNPCLHLAGPGDSAHARIHIACRHAGGGFFKPIKEGRIAQKAVFHNLAIACQKIAGGQRAQKRGIGQHQRRLMEGADKVLAVR